MKRLSLLLLIADIVCARTAARVLWDVRDATLRTKGIVAALNPEELTRQAIEVLGDKSIRVGTFVVYPSEEDLSRAAPKGGSDCTYGNTVSDLRAKRLAARSRRCPRISEAIKLGMNVVVRSLDADCRTTNSVLLKGGDPTELEVRGTKYQVLAISFAPSIKRASGLEYRVQFFLRTSSAVAEAGATAVLKYLQNTAQAKEVSVAVRNDRWFFGHCDYPTALFFDWRSEDIPSKSIYEAGREVVCVALPPWPVRCY
jgi:hypothetical protein